MSVEVTTLSNGLRVASDRMDHVESATLGVWLDSGTRYEAQQHNGIAHMLEHMLFKGTKTRSARALAEEIEAVGGSMNAYTGRETTAFHASVLKEDVGLAVDLIADILQNSLLEAGELTREKTVVLQEIGQARDTPDDVIFDHLQETAFPRQGIGQPVLGTEQTVTAMTRDDLADHLAQYYGTDRMILAASGRIDHGALVRLAERAFSATRGGEALGQPEPARYAGGELRDSRNLEQSHLTLGFEGLSYRDPDFYALAVFSTLFGGGMSSRLFQTVREERGLVYSIYSFSSTYADTGLFGIYAGTGADEVAQVVPLVCDEFARVGQDVNEAEVARARSQLKAATLMGLESTSNRCEQLARQMMIWQRPLTTEDIVARIEAVDCAAVRRVVARLLKSKPSVAALGPLQGLEALDRIVARLAA
ncbi:MAG: pitrilysin family protein [Rhodospirillales bacterium]